MAGSVTLTARLQSFMEGDATVVESLLREVLPRLHEIAAREHADLVCELEKQHIGGDLQASERDAQQTLSSRDAYLLRHVPQNLRPVSNYH